MTSAAELRRLLTLIESPTRKSLDQCLSYFYSEYPYRSSHVLVSGVRSVATVEKIESFTVFDFQFNLDCSGYYTWGSQWQNTIAWAIAQDRSNDIGLLFHEDFLHSRETIILGAVSSQLLEYFQHLVRAADIIS